MKSYKKYRKRNGTRWALKHYGKTTAQTSYIIIKGLLKRLRNDLQKYGCYTLHPFTLKSPPVKTVTMDIILEDKKDESI